MLFISMELCLMITSVKGSAGQSPVRSDRLLASAGDLSPVIPVFADNTDSLPSLPPTPAPAASPTSESTPVQEPSPLPTIDEAPKIDINKLLGQGSIIYPPNWGNKNKPEAFLTFDDGYDGNVLVNTLGVLKKKGVKCTFFIVGDALRNHPNLFKQAVADGHQVCNHTNKHRYFTGTVSEDEIKKEIEGWEKAARDILGDEYMAKMKKEFPFLRLPGGYGQSSDRVLKIITDAGYVPIGWSDETIYSVLRNYNLAKDPVGPIAEKVASHVISNAQNGSIILLHVNVFDTERLEDIIQGMMDKGLSLKPVSDIFIRG